MGGIRCPGRLAVYAAAIPDYVPAQEVLDARREVEQMARRFDLELGRLDALLAEPGPTSSVQYVERIHTEPVLLWDLEVGVDDRPTEPVVLDLVARDASIIGGVVVWFEALLDDGIVMHNRPGETTHWGQLVCSWPRERGLGLGGRMRVVAAVDDEGMQVTPLG